MSESLQEKLAYWREGQGLNVGLPSRRAVPKKTVDHTDDTINVVTEHYDDRQDVHINVRKPAQAHRSDQ